jgi:lipopolysaccharide transport system permease protein
VVFPLEILPVVALGSSLFHTAISLLLLIVIWSIVHGGVALAVAFIPLLILPLSLIAVGLGWFIAAATVYFRDLSQLVPFVSSGLLFFSPIFYPASSVPEPFRYILKFNPLTYAIEKVRATLISGEIPELNGYLIYLLISFFVAWVGYIGFQKTRIGFGDVI